LDLTEQWQLNFLVCSNNQLKSLVYASYILVLDCSDNLLTTLDITTSEGFQIEDMLGTCNISYNPLTTLRACSNASFGGFFTLTNMPLLQTVYSSPVNQGYFEQVIADNSYSATISNDCSLGVSEVSLDDFVIFPNPVNEELNISRNDNFSAVDIAIYNVLGQRVFSVVTSGSTIDVSSLKAGSYLLKKSTEQQISTCRFIKE
jgi:hypothetical protein